MIGQKIGPYQVLAKLGEGGMGDVYKATDTRLDRTVAVKVLPEHVASDPERRQRFEREARTLASLSHPHICPVFDVGSQDGIDFLVMEYLEGETLEQRLKKSTLAVDQALQIAVQIAGALAAAHRAGIVHRDLKPGNVMLTRSGAKLLDFGLAKTGASAVAGSLSMLPTTPPNLTVQGTILGTFQYMAPEQLDGQEADARTDIFAFGAVLYEIVTSRKAFEGKSQASLIAAILEREPPAMVSLQPLTPPLLDHIVRRCLAKDPEQRWQSAADVRMEIEAIQAGLRGLPVPTEAAVARQPLWRRSIPIASAAVVAAAISAFVAWNMRPTPQASIARFSIVLPADQQMTRLGRHNIAVSPDGQHIVYVANDQLYLRAIDDVEARPIQGTNEDVNTPFFSPDGRWIGFFSAEASALKKIAITGGAPVTIADVTNPFGATWGAGDQIVIGQGTQGIVRVAGNGGTVETIVKADAGEVAHGPQMLPDGDHLLFTLTKGTGITRWDQAQIVVQSLRTGERTVVIQGGSDARYVPTGHLVYAVGETVVAVPFDVRSLTVTGGPIPILEGVGRAASANTAAMYLSFAQSGALAYVVGGIGVVDSRNSRTLMLVDQKGVSTALPVSPQAYAAPRISPDGRQLAVSILTQTEANIWIYDLAGAVAPRRLTFGGENFDPAWTRDGRRIVFISLNDNLNAIFWQPADGSGSAERLTDPNAVQPTSLRLSSDAKHVVYRDTRGDDSIWILPLEGDRKPQRLIDGPGNQDDASLSPDGRWMVYESSETGRTQIYVQPFPPTGAKYQITTTTAAYDPMWSPDGRQIFYLEPSDSILFRLMSVDVRTESGFTYASPTRRFDRVSVAPGGAYDVASDGRRFVVLTPPADSDGRGEANAEIRVTLNWFEELRQRVPVN